MGMMAFLALAHMWDATQVMGWGCGWWRSLRLHTCEMLRKWWGGGAVWMMTFLALAHMWDATQLIQMCWYRWLYCYISWWFTSALHDCMLYKHALQFLETKTGAPLVVLAPPCNKTVVVSTLPEDKTGNPFIFLEPPQNNNSQKT